MWESIIEGITLVNGYVNSVVWGWPTIILILGTGLLFTIRLKVMQVRKLGESMGATIVPVVKDLVKKKPKEEKVKLTKEEKKKRNKVQSVSQFEAFCSAISGTVGTGNIIGTTSAILTGGPGAVFWMWISAFFGMITNYSENVLGLYYRKKDKDGSFSGGAFYYLENGFNKKIGKVNLKAVGKILGFLAAIFCLLAAVGMSGVQTNKISSTLATSFGVSDSTIAKLIIGIIIAGLVALIIIGGIKRIGKIASILVPFMTIIFIVLALVGIILNINAVPEAFKLIFANIFGFKAMAGGFGGYLFGQIIKKGMARGVFSNEAGLGSSVIAHSASETREPVKQGLWGIFEVFLDTFVICTLMALLVLTTYIRSGSLESFNSNTLDSATALNAFSINFGTFGTIAFSIILPLFAFTTILAWSYYGEKATEFCFKGVSQKAKRISVLIFKILFVLFIVASAIIESDLVWDLDDTFNGLMAFPNLVGLVFLSGEVVKITKNYYQRKKGIMVEPILSAYPEQNKEFIADLQKQNSPLVTKVEVEEPIEETTIEAHIESATEEIVPEVEQTEETIEEIIEEPKQPEKKKYASEAELQDYLESIEATSKKIIKPEKKKFASEAELQDYLAGIEATGKKIFRRK